MTPFGPLDFTTAPLDAEHVVFSFLKVFFVLSVNVVLQYYIGVDSKCRSFMSDLISLKRRTQ